MRSHNLLGQPVPVLYHSVTSSIKKSFLMLKGILLLFASSLQIFLDIDEISLSLSVSFLSVSCYKKILWSSWWPSVGFFPACSMLFSTAVSRTGCSSPATAWTMDTGQWTTLTTLWHLFLMWFWTTNGLVFVPAPALKVWWIYNGVAVPFTIEVTIKAHNNQIFIIYQIFKLEVI